MFGTQLFAGTACSNFMTREIWYLTAHTKVQAKHTLQLHTKLLLRIRLSSPQYLSRPFFLINFPQFKVGFFPENIRRKFTPEARWVCGAPRFIYFLLLLLLLVFSLVDCFRFSCFSVTLQFSYVLGNFHSKAKMFSNNEQWENFALTKVRNALIWFPLCLPSLLCQQLR